MTHTEERSAKCLASIPYYCQGHKKIRLRDQSQAGGDKVTKCNAVSLILDGKEGITGEKLVEFKSSPKLVHRSAPKTVS